MRRNWRTTITGIATIIGGVVVFIAGDKVQGVSTIAAGVGLVAARDNTKRLNEKR